MRIPLDYYRILGLPIGTSAEQLQQAYRDRTQQLPQREYSHAAIEARNQLIAAAYTVLSNPEQRQRYDASYFALSYEADASNDDSSPIDPSKLPIAIEPSTPSIEMADELFVGALLILHELGEYELVLDLGISFLDKNNLPPGNGQLGESYQVRSDIILTIALAYLELGREQWQQGQYENAASSLEYGQNLLSYEKLFGRVAGEIKADLDKLRPYRILELLAQSEANAAQRQQGLQLLQEILQERRGIDGTGDDGSGLSVEDFLRFIQQLRGYLTAAEQQSLFELESQRPSAVAAYLTVYALIALGFTQRQAVLIRQAKIMLMRLGKRQDLYLEQAICSLLLGQTTAASQALELSQEYEPLAFIRENSQGSPDLLPGLCLYSEGWLQNEVFPNFRDLAAGKASLKEYFADRQVQADLEALPTELEVTDELVLQSELHSPLAATSPPITEQRSPKPSRRNFRGRVEDSTLAEGQRGRGTRGQGRPMGGQGEEYLTHPSSHEPHPSSFASGVAVLPDTERVTTSNHNSTDSDGFSEQVVLQPSRRRTRNRVRQAGGGNGSEPLTRPDGNGRRAASKSAAKKNRILLLAGGAIALIGLWFLASQAYGLFKQIFAPSVENQLLVELNQPAVPIPVAAPKTKPAALTPLNQTTAAQVIQTWLSTKAAAFGSDHDVEKLEQILVQPALGQWQKRVQNDMASNRVRKYQHSVKVNAVTTAPATDNAQVEATVKEVAQAYRKGRLERAASYNETLQVQYNLVRQDGTWRIQAMKVLK